MRSLSAEALSLSYGPTPVVKAVTMQPPTGQISALLGRNGSGKSTLLRGFARLMAPASGAALLDGQAIHQLPTRDVARQLGLLPQGPEAPAGMSVRELVSLGRHPHRGRFGMGTPEDGPAVAEALALTGLDSLADRAVETLSGGQRQRAWIALTLAQRTDVLLLDEPTTFLDPAHQIEVMQLVSRLQAERGLTVLMVLHDLNLAARYADHLVLLADGEVLTRGTPAEVLTPAWLRAAYGVEADVLTDTRSGRPVVLPWGLTADAG
jgi:iron complex transport system ATP-binding protein